MERGVIHHPVMSERRHLWNPGRAGVSPASSVSLAGETPAHPGKALFLPVFSCLIMGNYNMLAIQSSSGAIGKGKGMLQEHGSKPITTFDL